MKLIDHLIKVDKQKEVKKIRHFFSRNYVSVKKNIPAGGGFGGGSSNASTFLIAIHNLFDLHLSQEELYEIGVSVGADICFFLSGLPSATIHGIGEIIEAYEEDPIYLDFITPNIACNTGSVYKEFRKNFFDPKKINHEFIKELERMKSTDILRQFTPTELNDLYAPSLYLYPELGEFESDNCFFNGSGSSFFKMI